jgi:peptidoglycan/xylan/chitin deacetylase (PgdA/CDA1 family)
MQYLAAHYTPLPLHELTASLESYTVPSCYPCAITFDDGTVDWLMHALPVLEKYGVPATFFTTTGFIGNGPIPYPRPHAPAVALTHDELKKLASSSLVTIGGHTVTHPHLSQLSDDEMRQEIRDSKRILEQWLGKPVTLYAYPFGNYADYNEATKRITREEGFTAGFSIEERTATSADDLYELPRMVVFDEPLWMFKVRVSGVIDDIAWACARVKKKFLKIAWSR